MAGFDALKTEVKARLGNRTDIDARLAVWINDALFELLMNPKASYPELDETSTITTVIGTHLYTMPDNFWFLLNLRDEEDERVLTHIHWQVLDRTARTVGTATRYARYGNTISLEPTPDDVRDLTLRYRIRVPEVATGDLFPIGRDWEEAITILAQVKGLEALQRMEEAGIQRQIFESILAQRLDVPTLEDASFETTIGVRFM